MGWVRKPLILLLALAVIALLAYGITRDPRAIPSPLVGREAPPFTLTLLDGGQLSLSELKGKPVLVNFWASWCYPACWNEAPRLQAAWERHRERGLMVVGIVYQDREGPARDFIRRHGKTYSNGMDPGSRIAINYGVYGIPESFFIDREGRITYKHVGEISAEILVARIEEILPSAAGGKTSRVSGGGWQARAD